MLSKDLLNSSIFARIDIFKMVKTKPNKKKMGIIVSKEILLKIKNNFSMKISDYENDKFNKIYKFLLKKNYILHIIIN